MDTPIDVKHQIAAFMSACVPLEQHLQEGAPLSEIDVESIKVTIMGLQTNLMVWQRKNGKGQ
jgi:hypothetical protein